jgi:hypothetical protein
MQSSAERAVLGASTVRGRGGESFTTVQGDCAGPKSDRERLRVCGDFAQKTAAVLSKSLLRLSCKLLFFM